VSRGRTQATFELGRRAKMSASGHSRRFWHLCGMSVNGLNPDVSLHWARASWQRGSSQRTQIIRHIPELAQHGRIAEIARGGSASTVERDRACMAQHFPETLRTLYRGDRAGHSIGSPTTMLSSPTSNGNSTKYVIPAIAHLLDRASPYGRGDRFKFSARVAARNGSL
jgi:hypothetical protein